MSSPFAFIRQYQKGMLAVFGIAIMFVFMFSGSGPTGDLFKNFFPSSEQNVAVKWNKGNVSFAELQQATKVHYQVLAFLEGILQKTFEDKGTPRVPDVSRQNPGITRATNKEGIFQKFVLAAKAEEMGIIVDDKAVFDFLDKLSDGILTHADYDRILATTLGKGRQRTVTPQQIFDQLKMEIAGRNLLIIIQRGLGAQTPVVAWTNFNRLNRRVIVEALPLKVDDFKAEVKVTPTTAELKELFEKYKNNYGSPQFATPGFRLWPQAKFQYFKVDFEKFLAEELPKVTEEEIKKEYELGISRGEYKVQELPASSDPKVETPKAPADEKKEDGAKTPPPQDPAKPDAPNKDEPKKDDAAKPAEKPADAPKPEEKKPDPVKVDNKPEEKKPDAKDGSSRLDRRSSALDREFFVNAVDEKAADPAKPTEKKDEKKGDDGADKKDAPPVATKDAEPKKEPPATTPEKTMPPADDKAKTEEKADPKAEKKPEEPKFKPLSEVHDEVAKRVAKPRAQEAKKKAIEEVRKKVETYGRELHVWEKFRDKDKELAEPKLDMEALAEKLKITFGQTDLITEVTAQETELGKNVSLFYYRAFRMQLQTYKPQVPEFDEDVTYVWWKTEEIPERVPTFADAKEKVLDAFKKTEALKLAKAAAVAKIKEVKEKESLATAFGDKVITTNPFSWMTTGNLAFGDGRPRLSSVEGVEGAGMDFMEKVFALKEGDLGYAVNEPQSIVYVIRLAQEMTKVSMREELFLEGGNNNNVRMLWGTERQQLLSTWYGNVEKEMKVTWRDQPQMQESDE